MSEMLGNQYFLARKYSLAVPELEQTLLSDPGNIPVTKKLIVSYTQVGKIDESFNLFYHLVIENVESIINTDIILDDCPCPQIVENLQDSASEIVPQDSQILKMLGILWLYCEIEKSKYYFQEYLKIKGNDCRVKSILKILDEFILHHGELN